MYEQRFMQRALDLSREALTKPGTEPFGSVVVRDGVIVGEGLNHSAAHFDPTSHGEVEAIRDACRRLECVDLTGAELYTTCEPCALCVATMNIVGIGKLYYAASMAQAGKAFETLTKAERHPIDTDVLSSECALPVQERRMPAEQHEDAAAVDVLKDWVELKKAG
ncbi:nucleoside deaminase [Chthonobacter albigriseus]|uniref:nucleoside deaminase n=1 Tax=Chthonobacter albigriseus TaxID=1683161 RepID=UPI0015EFB745|nr:nucleoside deaminase [Chthonobacter albigriseus]